MRHPDRGARRIIPALRTSGVPVPGIVKMPRISAAGQGHLAMLLFAAITAGSFSIGGLIANEIAPAVLNAVRFLLAAAVIGALVATGPGLRRRDIRAPWRHFILGALFACFFVAMFEGLKTADPVAIGAVFTLTPLMSAAIARVLVGQRITPRMALALPAAGVGAAWVIFRADFDAILAFEIGRGEAIFLAGCASYALYAPMVRKVHRGEPILSFTLLTFAAGIVFLVAYGWRDLLATQWAAVPWTVWLALAYLSFLASALTFLLIQFAALRLPAAKVMAYTFLTPSLVILLEALIGHGLPNPLILPGAGLTIAGLALLLKDEEASTARN